MNHAHHLLVTHIYIQIWVRGPSHRPCQTGQLTKGRGPNYLSQKYTHEVAFKDPWVLQLSYDYTHFLHTRHLLYTHSTPRAETATTLDFCGKAAMWCVQTGLKGKSFLRSESKRDTKAGRTDWAFGCSTNSSLWGGEPCPVIFQPGEMRFWEINNILN